MIIVISKRKTSKIEFSFKIWRFLLKTGVGKKKSGVGKNEKEREKERRTPKTPDFSKSFIDFQPLPYQYHSQHIKIV